MTRINDMTLAGIRARYAAGTTPAELMAELRLEAERLAEHTIFIHLISADELQPWIDRLATLSPEDSPLWGVPFVLKDNIDLAGIPTTAACEAFSHVPQESAFVVQQLLAAGALPLGKANLDQFATGLNGTRSPWGPCRNSFDKSLVSGGSSAGSAVAVALGLASFSLGTDTAGSGRIPAGLNNLIGVKPTRGLISATGVVPACRSLDCVSIFALHADDANAVLAVAEGQDDADSYSRQNPHDNRSQQYGCYSEPLTLGIIAESQLKFFGDEDYKAAYHATLAALREQGVQFREIDYGPFDEVALLLYEGPWVSERYLATQPLIDESPESLFPVVRDIIEPGGKPLATDLFRAQYRLEELRKRCQVQMRGIDALLTPTAGRFYSIDEMLQEPIRCNSELGYYMNFMNLLDMAAVAVPASFSALQRPFGITISSAAFTDRHLLSIANRIQQWLPLPLATGSESPPALSTRAVGRTDWIPIAVCGAHLQGMPLNAQLGDRGAQLLQTTRTSDDYRLFALDEASPQRPALIKVAEGGVSIEVEVWNLPSSQLGGFLRGIAAPLGLGTVTLASGQQVHGFIAQSGAEVGAEDISAFGGWRAYVQAGSSR